MCEANKTKPHHFFVVRRLCLVLTFLLNCFPPLLPLSAFGTTPSRRMVLKRYLRPFVVKSRRYNRSQLSLDIPALLTYSTTHI
jgi:hypothetical protein